MDHCSLLLKHLSNRMHFITQTVINAFYIPTRPIQCVPLTNTQIESTFRPHRERLSVRRSYFCETQTAVLSFASQDRSQKEMDHILECCVLL